MRLPTTPAAELSIVREEGRRAQRRQRLRTARALVACVAVVLTAGAIVTGALSVTGTGFCTTDEQSGDEVCVRTTWWAFTIQKRAEQWTLNGEPHGTRTEWHKNGELWFSGDYFHGKRTGPFSEFWENGVVRFQGNYQDDALNGEERWYFPDGTLEWSVMRIKGKRHGVERWYWPNGALRREGSYQHGEKHGPFVSSHIDGHVTAIAHYKNGVVEPRP